MGGAGVIGLSNSGKRNMPGLVSAGVHFTTVVILIVLMPLSGQHGKYTLFYNQMVLYAMGAAKTITLHVGFGIVTDF